MTTDKQAAFDAIDTFVDDYVESYVLDDGECYHEPTEHERFLIEDAINGLIADHQFEELMAATLAAERDALRALNRMLRAELQSTKDALRAEVERLRAAARAVCEEADARAWVLGRPVAVPAKALDDLRDALYNAARAAQEGKT